MSLAPADVPPESPTPPSEPDTGEPGAEPRVSEPARPRKLSEELRALSERITSGEVTLREMIAILQGRAYDLLILLLALPFVLPIPLPGLSTPFGLVIALIAARMTLRQRPWLPARLLDTRLPAGFFPRILRGARHIVRGLELFLRPRLPWMTRSPQLIQVHAAVMLAAALVLLLPLPPGTNFLPALCILVMTAGLLERDGVFVFGGYVLFALNAVFFTLIAIYGMRFFHLLWERLTS